MRTVIDKFEEADGSSVRLVGQRTFLTQRIYCPGVGSTLRVVNLCTFHEFSIPQHPERRHNTRVISWYWSNIDDSNLQ